MAHRLATEYVNAKMQMTDIQMNQFLQNTVPLQVNFRVKVIDGGGQEIVIDDDSGEEVHLSFERKNGMFVCVLSCRLITPRLTNTVRKLFSAYKGSGKVNRIYNGFIMSYDYLEGTVRRISQLTDGSCTLVYEYKNTAGELQRLYESREAEVEIDTIRGHINCLLDQRLAAAGPTAIQSIDEQLRSYNQQLFMLEA